MMEGIGGIGNVYGANVVQQPKTEGNRINNSQNKPLGESSLKGIDTFDTVQYTSKKDGKTYLAKKMTIKGQDGESVTGVYVYDKSAKPDKNGTIYGTFMSYDTFMKKMSDELPTINSNYAKAYFPNIHTSSPNDRSETAALKGDIISPDEIENKVNEMLDKSVKLSDGSIMLQPCIIGEDIQIKSTGEGNYTVTHKPSKYGSTPKIEVVSEHDLIMKVGRNSYVGGLVTKTDDGKYHIEYYDRSAQEKVNTELSAAELLNFMEEHSLTTYKE